MNVSAERADGRSLPNPSGSTLQAAPHALPEWQALASAYRSRAAAGRPGPDNRNRTTIGIIGSTVPPEFILAVGGTPVFLSAATDDDFEWSGHIVDDELLHETRSLIEQVVRGDYEYLDLLLIAGTSEAHVAVYEFLKYFVASGAGSKVPPLFLCDVTYDGTSASLRYSRYKSAAVIRRIESAANRLLTPESLLDAIGSVNRMRLEVGELLSRRSSSAGIAGSRVLEAIGGALALGFQDGPDALGSYIAQLDEPGREAEATVGPPRLLLCSAEPLYHTRLHRAIERCGANVVEEDDWHGSRYATGELHVDESARLPDCVLDFYRRNAVNPKMPIDLRYEWLLSRLTDAEVDAVLFYMPPSDQVFGWIYPELSAAATRAGLPTILIRHDVLASDSEPGLVAHLGEAIDGLGKESGADQRRTR